jgi:FkbM family methyltransferase
MKLIYWIIYSPLINFFLRSINKFLKNISSGIKIPPSGVINIKLNNNEIIKFKTNQTSFVGFRIYWYGIYNYEYTYIFEQIIKNIKVFIDIGANSGLYSLIAAKKSNNIKILAFDPTNAAHYYLNENIRINNFADKITSFKYAISDKTEILDFYEVRNKKYPNLKYNLGGSSSLINHPQLYNKISVQAFSFDNFLAEHSYTDLAIDFIKIDAEGAEPSIIRGMRSTIEKYKPIVVCEILLNDVDEEIEKIFMEFGYEFFLNKSRDLIPVKRIQKNISDDEIYNYFLVHPSKLYVVQEFISSNNRDFNQI